MMCFKINITYSYRKHVTEDHSRIDVGSSRAQRKRIEHLEEVLRRLNHGQQLVQIDPEKVVWARADVNLEWKTANSAYKKTAYKELRL